MLITLEGLDGSGKTTVWEALRAEGGDDGGETPLPASTVFTCEPTETWYGDAISRSIADDEADPLAELFLYTADHAAHLDGVVRPALDEGRIVVSDRYSDSRFAYQGVALADIFDEPMRFVEGIHQPWTRQPDATLYFDLDPETAAERSGVTNKFETADYLASVRENYEILLADEPERFVPIDASQPPDDVLTRVKRSIAELLS